jgi:hypothetical protein
MCLFEFVEAKQGEVGAQVCVTCYCMCADLFLQVRE